MNKDSWPLSNPAYAAHQASHVPFSELTGPAQFVADGLIALGSIAVRFIVRVATQASRMRRINRTMDALSELDDRTLRDIGLSREQIPLVALGAVDDLGKDRRAPDRR